MTVVLKVKKVSPAIFHMAICLFSLFITAEKVYSQPVNYTAINYGLKEYGKDRDMQNWAVVQRNNGLLYFGNAGGLLEFDGKSWRFIPCVKNAFISALATDENGGVYIGTQNGFGLLKPDKSGKLAYVSLSDSVLSEIFNPRVNSILILNEHVYFQTEEAIFVFSEGIIKKLLPETSFHLAFKANNEIYVKERGKGILKIAGDKMMLMPGSEIFAEYGVFGILPIKENQNDLLIITQELGIWKYADKKFKRINSADENKLLNSQIYGSYRLKDGRYALNTLVSGLIIIDQNANIIEHIHTSNSGIVSDDIKQFIEDQHGDLWLACSKGISFINKSSPLSFYGEESGLNNNITALTRYKGDLYAGTSNGLFRIQNGEQKFSRLAGIDKEVWCLEIVDNKLLIGGNEALYTLNEDDKVRIIRPLNVRSMCYLPSEKVLFCGGKEGIAVFSLENYSFRFINKIEEIFDEIISINYIQKSETLHEIWAGSSASVVYRMKVENSETKTIEKYSTEDGLSGGFVFPFKFNEQMIFGTNQGIMFFVSEEEVISSIADTSSYKNQALKGFFINGELLGMNFRRPVSAFIYQNNDVALAEIDQISIYHTQKWIVAPFRLIEHGTIRCFYKDENDICWIGADDALISYDASKLIMEGYLYQSYIRKVFCGTDSILYFGEKSLKQKQDIIQLDYNNNSLGFEFAANWFIKTEKTSFSYLLEGNDKNWSDWTTETKVRYTNLKEGKYTFHLKAKNVYGEESEIETFAFEIIPPWYRTIWAYLLYLLLAVILVYIIVRLSQLRLKRKNERLEKIIDQRTVEIRHERDKSEKLLLNTLPIKVVNDLKIHGKTEPESFAEVSVYFSDVVGFTDMSTTMEPAQLISELNDIFTAFDDIMSKHQCERIKTIGDAYMAVCGMPEQNEHHAENMLVASKAIINYLEERNKTHELKWKIRIGLNSGSVVGGIVGVRKYIYDVFGDTINTASRMESNSEPMRINVSESTYKLLKDKYPFQTREPQEIKGKGVLKMYFAE